MLSLGGKGKVHANFFTNSGSGYMQTSELGRNRRR